MDEFQSDINDIEINSWYSSVSGVKTTQRKNESHTTKFFRTDPNNKEIVYCKICENNLKNSQQKPYPYTRKGGNTSNLDAHLRDKHKITRDNYKQFLDESDEPTVDQTKITNFYKKSAPCTNQRQTYLSQLLIKFIIKFVEPLYILQDEDFYEFVNACEPGFRIPCTKTAKGFIHQAYNWNVDQLNELISNTATCVHLTTDLWTAKSKHSYIGVTGTWLSEDYAFKEVLLACSNLAYPHSGEIISAELFSIIQKWNLSSLVYIVTTDNATNMIKRVDILKSQLSGVTRIACAAHTLQLTVQEGLKQCKAVHRRIKNLQAFFKLPKQAQRLYKAQLQIKDITITSDNQNDNYNDPLNVLSDTKTRWNSTYLAWKRVLELYTAMKLVSTTLLSKKDRASQLEGEKLDRLCLTVDEKNFIENMIDLLSPFEMVTRRICGAKYPTLNLVYPCIEVLKKKFQPQPEKNETYDSYLTLIYGELNENLSNRSNIEEISDTDDSSSVSEDENISSAGKRQHWQFAHLESDNINEIEYLPPSDTSDLLDKARAAIYLSLDELWCIPNEIALIASVLDPRMKSLRFTTAIQQTNTKLKLRELYQNLKDNLQLQDQSQTSNANSFSENDNLDYDDFFAEVFNLEGTNNTIIESDDDER
ncbi:24407_t:CDS:2 [Gigaspora rosea]|nr:24407_t:CDS:2 [Gigaspora rosea]